MVENGRSEQEKYNDLVTERDQLKEERDLYKQIFSTLAMSVAVALREVHKKINLKKT